MDLRNIQLIIKYMNKYKFLHNIFLQTFTDRVLNGKIIFNSETVGNEALNNGILTCTLTTTWILNLY